ncbi:thioesterase family protein [Marinobacterium arenosum]|uniref:thioesterase family protein n=1 Tax=Marinobacterium arenosum TaxID=2862496 RepID=UPI001C96D7C3|nr:thioesterase family protein [Marinobacterium arenosum]MBY4678742.1 thioesterase family protein [Marinobacterium arenosum]
MTCYFNNSYLKTPFGPIAPEACDYNGHFNEAQGLVLLTRATDTLLDWIGLDESGRSRLQFSAFTVQNRLYYLKEGHAGQQVSARTQLLGWDDKRLRLFHQLVSDEDQQVLVEMESLLLGVDMTTRRSARWPAPVAEALSQLMRSQKVLPQPANAGREIDKPLIGQDG